MLFWAAGGILAGCDNTLDGSGTYEPLYLEVAVSDSLGNTYTGDSIVIPTDKNKIIFDISTNSGWRASRENKVGLNGWLWFAIFALYAICAVSRLGYFNVAEEMRQKETTEKRKYYQGLPVTSSSLIFPAVYLLKAAVGLGTMQGIYGIMMLVVALAFVIDFKVIKPGLKGILAMGVVGVFIFIGLILL